ncbi:MAG: HlyD family efflux transporter periplasmic adaptor subunit [Mucilaginibacter sp.]
MPDKGTNDNPRFVRHSDEMQDIITAVPARLIRWGMTLFALVLAMIIGLSAYIHYPDIVKTTLTIKADKNDDRIFGELNVTQGEINKVIKGQAVLIKLKAYPFEQYGVITGKIESVTRTLDNAGNYSASAMIISNTTSLNKALPLKPDMLADAEIITQDATILQRLSGSMFKTIRNK